MNIDEAKRIGGIQATKSILIGVAIAQLIMTLLVASDNGIIKVFFWFTSISYLSNIGIGILFFLIIAYYLGGLAGKDILITQKDADWVGVKYVFLIVFISSFFASLIGFFQEGLDNIGSNDNPFEDYIFKPMFWIITVGLIPVVITGLWFGNSIKKKNTQRKEENDFNT